MILSSEDVPQLWLLLNEAVVRRVVGGREVMKRQIIRLIEVSKMPNVSLQIVPFNAGAHPAMDGSFILLSFPEPTDPHIVYIEYHSGALYLEKPSEVDRYRVTFDHLRATAASMGDSRGIMERAAEELA